MKQSKYLYPFQEDTLGVITTKKKNIFSRKNSILVEKGATRNARGYLATITDLDIKSDNLVCTNDLSIFNDGDVVLLNTLGEIIFLYEKNSVHNSIFATEKCNHRCIMCPQPPILQEKDKTEFNLKLISLIDKDTCEIGITGGEPTLIGENLFVLIKAIQKRLPNTPISLLSNGVKFSDIDYAKKLALCKHFDLQIDVPIFSDIADDHNAIVGAKTFYKTIQGLYNLALFKQKIGLRIVIHKKTYQRLPQLADFIYHNFPFVSQVAFLQMETIGLAKSNLEELWIDPHDYNNELSTAIMMLHERGINAYIYNAQLCVLPENLRQFAQNSISDWKETYLPECKNCKMRKNCGGLFASSQDQHSKFIKPFK